MAMAVLALAGGWALRLSGTEWCIVIFAIALVLAAECFNTAIEYLTDLVMPDYHETAGKVKDISAGAVLICSTAAAFTGLVVFGGKLLALLQAG